jgi:hypothetical protein
MRMMLLRAEPDLYAIIRLGRVITVGILIQPAVLLVWNNTLYDLKKPGQGRVFY